MLSLCFQNAALCPFMSFHDQMVHDDTLATFNRASGNKNKLQIKKTFLKSLTRFASGE